MTSSRPAQRARPGPAPFLRGAHAARARAQPAYRPQLPRRLRAVAPVPRDTPRSASRSISTVGDLDPDGVIAFLEDLETARGNTTVTRNARLAAIHAFARFVAAQHPEYLDGCQRLLAVPFKRARHSRRRLPRRRRVRRHARRYRPHECPMDVGIERSCSRMFNTGAACRNSSTSDHGTSSSFDRCKSEFAARDARSGTVLSVLGLRRF